MVHAVRACQPGSDVDFPPNSGLRAAGHRDCYRDLGMAFDLEAEVLRAARELRVHRQELQHRIGTAVGGDPYEYWLNSRRWNIVDAERDGQWSWVPLAFGFDVYHVDGRRLWLEYGHGHSIAPFTAPAFDCFVRHARAPWGNFSRLAHPLLSNTIIPLIETLIDHGYLAYATPGYLLTEKGLVDGMECDPQFLR
jgi:hypothetical protein